jgi:hypothetical protein
MRFKRAKPHLGTRNAAARPYPSLSFREWWWRGS